MKNVVLNEQVDIIENKLYRFSSAIMKILIRDNTTKGNLHWATNTYEKFGEWFAPEREMKIEQLVNANILTPRVSKSSEEQQARTKDKGEVFTPAWMCNMQVNYLDEDWFGRKNVFNKEIKNSWKTNKKKITFSQKLKKSWQEYVSDTRLEITCGEAPYLVSRYDVVKGEIIPVENRIGILDRKLRIINENVDDEDEWLEQAEIAFKSTYGYDYQGDNVVIARENLLYTLIDNMMFKFGHQPSTDILKKFSTIISWNIWQMDGLDYTIPYSEVDVQKEQIQLNLFGDEPEAVKKEKQLSKIKNWETNKTIEFKELIGGKSMKFDYIIGNPPYQNNTLGNNDKYSPPVYNIFLDEAYKISNKVEMIHPARFLFNAGSTPKEWNNKMLNDDHLKVLFYRENEKEIFPNATITGGIAITYHDNTKNYKKIGTFTPYSELNNIKNRILEQENYFLSDIAVSSYAYHFTEQIHIDNPDYKTRNIIVNGVEQPLLSKGHEYDLKSNVIGKLKEVFFDSKPKDGKEYVRVLGREDNERVYKYIQKDYINVLENTYKNKVILSGADGAAGQIGKPIPARIIGAPTVGVPGDISTESFMSIGSYDSKKEAEALCKYLKTKFARVLIGIVKVTQNITPDKFSYVPKQDFTNSSDVDWSKSIKEIDKQLYKKYKLSKEEIDFIESHVKEME